MYSICSAVTQVLDNVSGTKECQEIGCTFLPQKFGFSRLEFFFFQLASVGSACQFKWVRVSRKMYHADIEVRDSRAQLIYYNVNAYDVDITADLYIIGQLRYEAGNS